MIWFAKTTEFDRSNRPKGLKAAAIVTALFVYRLQTVRFIPNAGDADTPQVGSYRLSATRSRGPVRRLPTPALPRSCRLGHRYRLSRLGDPRLHERAHDGAVRSRPQRTRSRVAQRGVAEYLGNHRDHGSRCALTEGRSALLHSRSSQSFQRHHWRCCQHVVMDPAFRVRIDRQNSYHTAGHHHSR